MKNKLATKISCYVNAGKGSWRCYHFDLWSHGIATMRNGFMRTTRRVINHITNEDCLSAGHVGETRSGST